MVTACQCEMCQKTTLVFELNNGIMAPFSMLKILFYLLIESISFFGKKKQRQF
jgi:hypothetical protein